MRLYFIISQIDYEGGYIHGVFSNQERAEEARVKASRSRLADNFEIVETTLDEYREDGIIV